MSETLRPLPILSADGELPAGEALDTLRRAKAASGYPGLILPRKAVQGSPGPILAVGIEPDWLTSFAYIPDLTDIDRVTAALRAVLLEPDDPRIGDEAYLLSKWMGVKVTEKKIGFENYS